MGRRRAGLVGAAALCAAVCGAGPAGAASVTEGAVNPATAFVRVEAFGWSSLTGFGNAVAIGPDRLLTACHVIAGAEKVLLVRNEQRWPTRLVEAVPQADLCVLDRPPDLEIQPILIADPPSAGAVSAVTFWPDRPGATLARGEVIGTVPVQGQPLILTDLPLVPGMSGGGVFNAQGALIGLAIGRWHRPAAGVVIGLTALRDSQPQVSPAALAQIPDYVDEQKVWADMLLFGLSQSPGASGAQSGVFGGWHVSRQNSACLATLRDAEQADLGFSLDIRAGERAGQDPPQAHLAVEQQLIPFALASQPLSVTVLPSLREFSFRPARLLQGKDGVADNVWSVRWELDDATDFIRLLPGADGVIVSSGHRDLGALSLDSQALWSGLRQTCL